MQSIFQQTSILMVILVGSSVLAVSMGSYFILEKLSIDFFEDQAIQETHRIAFTLNSLLQLKEQAIQITLGNTDTKELILGHQSDPSRLDPMFDVLKNVKNYQSNPSLNPLRDFRILNNDFVVVYSLNHEEIGKSIEQISLKTDYADFPHLHFAKDPDYDVPVVIYTSPIYDDQTVIGYAVGTFHREIIDTILQTPTESSSSEFYVVDSNKLLVTPSRFIGYETLETLVDTIPVRKCLDEGSDYSGIYDDYRGISVFGASQCLTNYHLVFLHEMDIDEINAPIRELVLQDFIVTAVVLTVSLIVAILFSSRINNSIKRLVDFSQQLIQGNYNTKYSGAKRKEISILSNAINKMIDAIQVRDKELAEKQQIISEQLEKLRDLDIQKTNFSMMISHELKSPLTPIKGYCEILKDADLGPLNQEQKDAIAKIERNAERLDRLISDLLDLQKLETAKMTFTKNPFDVVKFFEEIKSDFASLLVDKQINLTINSNYHGSINSDKMRIKQVFDNLIKNSIDFVSQDNGIIEIQTHIENDMIIFSIKDNGIGIPKQKQSSIFKKFFQADTSFTRKHGGTGLGLNISKNIVEQLGGKIWFESQEGIGTTFYFSLPSITI